MSRVLLRWGCSNYKSNKVAEKVAAAAAAEEADEAEQAALEAAAQQAELESKEATKSLRKRSTCPRQPPCPLSPMLKLPALTQTA